ncbi:chorismate mutase [Lacticaseibacillus sp. GG6-2]
MELENVEDIAAWQRAQAGLAEEREQINQIDAQIAKLIATRFATVEHIAELKKSAAVPVLNADREAQVLDHVADAVADDELAPHVRRIFTTIMAESRNYQEGRISGQQKKA